MKHENETKRKLLDTAITLIWQSSYGSVSVDDICRQAGINKGSFYYAFKSKSDLAVAAFEHHWQALQPSLDSDFSPQVPALERIDRYCQGVIDDQKKSFAAFGKVLGCPFCSLGSELSTQDENVRAKAEQISARLVKYLESAVRDLAAAGLIETRDTQVLAREINSYVGGVMLQAKIENSIKAVERLKPGVLRLLNVKQLVPAAV